MAAEETILQAVREWLKTAATLTDSQVRVSEDRAVKPSSDFLTVKVTSPGIRVGHDEKVNAESGGTPTVAITGERRASVSIQGFGADTFGWLETAELSLSLESIQNAIQADGVTIVSSGSVSDVSDLVDTAFESRYLLEVEVRYRITGDTVNQTEATNLSIDTTFEKFEGDPDSFTKTITGNF